MRRDTIGIDNGPTGTIGIIYGRVYLFQKTPIKKQQDYTKKKKIISRVDVEAMTDLFSKLKNPFALLERPFVNPKMFIATMSAIRVYESTITILEALGIGYAVVDSKEWQKVMLPKGTKGTTALKKASKDIGTRLCPQFKIQIEAHGDADGLLMAEYARRRY